MRSIVVGTDGSANAEAAVRRAVEIVEGAEATVHLVAAYPGTPSYGERLVGTARREQVDLRGSAEALLARAANEFSGSGATVQTDAREGDPAAVILELAEEQGADLIVVGARGATGLQRFLMGSVASKLVHHAPCSVLIVRER
jgi:nucleotide-binding universal stress UspA family protein